MPVDFDASAQTWDTEDRIGRARHLGAAITDAVPLEPGWSALEIGCGTGQLTWSLADRLGAVALIDVSPGMLEVARRHAAALGAPERFTIASFDLSTRPWPHPVDLAYSALALHHIHDTATLLTHLRASLRPGGWVALADLDPDPGKHYHGDDFDGHHGIDRHALARALQDLGFAQVAERTALTVTKTRDGVARDHQVFLVTGRLPG